MSADCETVTPSMGSETLQHTLTLPQNTSIRSDRHSHQGISYEGRVSLISPLGQYEDSLRSTFGNGQGPNISPPHMYSPPFQSTEFPPSSNAGSFGVSEETQRVLLSMHSMNYGASGSNKNYDSYQKYQMDYSSQKPTYIKEEAIDMVSHNRPKEETPISQPSSSPSQSSFLNSDINTDADVSTIDKNEINSPFLDMPKTTNPPSLPEDFNGLNGTENPLSEDHSSDGPSSPFAFNDNGPPSVNSDQNEYREIDPVTFMKASYNGIHDIFNLHGENSKALKCQFCLYSTDDESSFTSHLNSHFIHKCMKCEHTTKTVDQLKEHLLAEHGINPEDIVDIESTKVPYMNSQGKVKTFKCKQCGFVAVTKGEFWTHAKSHIKSEKLLSCNKCQFVTEYKHHLEYHMRNHFGSKPFKCNKCSYSCVNKSMLNSHMKSHSNIYQYRCSDCTYATKYCHSLKLHLRKYAHTPAMVLNPDGSPNPVPIIDVYGTRRGPKLKKDENGMPILPPHYQLQAHIVRAQMEITGTIPPAPTVPIEKCNSSKNANKFPWNIPVSMASFPNQPQLPQVNNKNKYPSFIPNEYKDPIEKSYESQEKRAKIDTSSNSKEQNLNVSKSPEVEETLLCDICNFSTSNRDILSHHVLLHNQNKREPERNEFVHSDHGNHKINLADMMSPKSMNLNFMKENNIKPQKERQMPLQPQIPSQFPPPQNVLHDYFVRAINPLLYSPMIPGQNFVHPALEIQHQIQRFMYQNSKDHNNDISMESPTRRTNGQTDPALNLSKEQTPPNSGQHSSHGQPSTFPTFLPASPPSSDISTPPSKSRRKGRAYKLERIASRLSGSGEDENSESPKIGNHTQSRHDKIGDLPPLLPLDLAEHKNSNSYNESKWGEAHQCQYCDIAFKDIVMYTMHMGYHGYEDPFKCNMCGFDATDKVAFFLHIGRSSHL